MKTIVYLSLTLAACRLFAQSPNPAWRHLPPDAAAIYHLNLAALTDKVPWYALAAPIPAPQHNTDNRELVAILRTPDKAGVDIRRDLFIIQSGTTSTDTGETTSYLFQLTDTARWTAFLRAQDPGLHLLTAGADTGFAGREKMGVAWNSQYAVLTFVHRLPHPAQLGETRRVAIHRSLTLLRGYDDSSGIHDPLFLNGFANDADIHAWTRPGQLLYSFFNFLVPSNHPLVTRPAPPAGPCLHSLSTLRFEKGRITLSSIICLPHGADSIYARLIDHPLSTNIAAGLPQTGTLGQCNLHFNPGLLPDLLNELQTRGATEELLFDKGLSLESFAHGFQGDFAMIATHADHNNGARPFTLSFAAATLDQPAVRQWTNSLHPSGCTLRDSLLLIGPMPSDTATTAITSTTVARTAIASTAIPATASTAIPATASTAIPAIASTAIPATASTVIPATASTAIPATASTAIPAIASTAIPATASTVIPATASTAITTTDTTTTGITQSIPPFDPSAPLTGYLDCKTLAGYWKGLPLLSVMDKLTFTAGRLNAAGQIENDFELTLADPHAYSLQTLWPLLSP